MVFQDIKFRKASVSREFAIVFEETQRGTMQELITYFSAKKVKKKIVIVAGGKEL